MEVDPKNPYHGSCSPSALGILANHDAGIVELVEGPDFLYTVPCDTCTGSDLTHHCGCNTNVATCEPLTNDCLGPSAILSIGCAPVNDITT